MKKLFSPTRIVLAIASVFTLAGCELYFGGHDEGGGDKWTYCASDGYYVCEADNCDWAGPRCPDDPEYTCETNADCAAGCHCEDGKCVEAGFCGRNGECPEGYHCEVDRSSCVPDGCTTSADCPAGEYCDPASQQCTGSCTCDTDAQAQTAGWAYCDEARHTCEPANPAGSCGGAVTCNQIMTVCPAGQVAQVNAGCWTGQCVAITGCDVTPVCSSLQHEADCLGRSAECTSVYTGLNCTNSSGQQCMSGSTGCTCAEFRFASCRDRTSAMSIMTTETAGGQLVDAFAQ